MPGILTGVSIGKAEKEKKARESSIQLPPPLVEGGENIRWGNLIRNEWRQRRGVALAG